MYSGPAQYESFLLIPLNRTVTQIRQEVLHCGVLEKVDWNFAGQRKELGTQGHTVTGPQEPGHEEHVHQPQHHDEDTTNIFCLRHVECCAHQKRKKIWCKFGSQAKARFGAQSGSEDAWTTVTAKRIPFNPAGTVLWCIYTNCAFEPEILQLRPRCLRVLHRPTTSHASRIQNSSEGRGKSSPQFFQKKPPKSIEKIEHPGPWKTWQLCVTQSLGHGRISKWLFFWNSDVSLGTNLDCRVVPAFLSVRDSSTWLWGVRFALLADKLNHNPRSEAITSHAANIPRSYCIRRQHASLSSRSLSDSASQGLASCLCDSASQGLGSCLCDSASQVLASCMDLCKGLVYHEPCESCFDPPGLTQTSDHFKIKSESMYNVLLLALHLMQHDEVPTVAENWTRQWEFVWIALQCTLPTNIACDDVNLTWCSKSFSSTKILVIDAIYASILLSANEQGCWEFFSGLCAPYCLVPAHALKQFFTHCVSSKEMKTTGKCLCQSSVSWLLCSCSSILSTLLEKQFCSEWLYMSGITMVSCCGYKPRFLAPKLLFLFFKVMQF